MTVIGRPVEVQIRTRLQHQWANLFEKFADIVGRGVRYGEPPDVWTMIFEVSFERYIRDDRSTSRILADELVGERGFMGLIIECFGIMSREIHACETAATFHGNPEIFEQTNPPDELPSLEELERRKEIVFETARALERNVHGLLRMKAAFESEMEAIKGEFSAPGGLLERSELDREGLRAELRRQLGLVSESSSSGGGPVPTDRDGDER